MSSERSEVAERRSVHAINLDNYIPALLTYISIKLSSGAAAIYRREFDITITDWRIMAQLAGEPWMPSARITEVLRFDKAAVSRSVKSMSAKGLIETRFHGNNRRRQHLALTAEGLRIHDQIVRIALDRERQLVAGLSDEERTVLVRFLTRMVAELPKLSD
jgi:DNA-binding MarR family transcriptional regulator